MDIRRLVLWIAAIVLILLGFVGTVAPGLPGILLIFAGMLLAAWTDHFSHIGVPTLLILGALAILALIVDLLSSMLGAQRVGASRLAIVGSVVGGFVGLAFGLPGLILGPFVGAVAGEYLTGRRLGSATRVGIGTFVGLVMGTLVKLALAVTMLGVFVLGYFL